MKDYDDTAPASGIEDWCDRHSSLIEEYALQIVSIPSPQPEGDVRGVADKLAEIASTIPGVRIERYISEEPVHNLVLTLAGSRPGPRLIFNGHTDTFPLGNLDTWSKDPWGEVAGDRIYGLGISDMKGGLAASLFALKCLAECQPDFPGEIVCTFAGDEETMGALGTKYLLESVPHARGDAMISGDVGSPSILRVGEKGMIWATLRATGQSAHAAHVHKGDSAIEKLTAAMARISELREWEVSDAAPDVHTLIDRWSEASESLSGPGETEVLKSVTVTFGTFNGGRLPNLVADAAEMSVDIRLPVGVAVADIEAHLERICAGIDGVTLEITRRFEPSWTDPESSLVTTVRNACAHVLEDEIAVTMRVGASDARLYRYAGVPSVVCGLTPFNMGAADEYILRDELSALGKIFALSALHFLSGQSPTR
ncbi:MAG TPA: M20/M25/M40 family metallo-hydrolase [Paracoccaceae bacterium]|nr:M20/M25/M40 family metallo-hydrolase [Paracoccaceae bacterium]